MIARKLQRKDGAREREGESVRVNWMTTIDDSSSDDDDDKKRLGLKKSASVFFGGLFILKIILQNKMSISRINKDYFRPFENALKDFNCALSIIERCRRSLNCARNHTR